MNYAEYFEAKEQERLNAYCSAQEPVEVPSDEECKIIDKRIEEELAKEREELLNPAYLDAGIYMKHNLTVEVDKDHNAYFIPFVDGVLKPSLKWRFAMYVRTLDKMWEELDYALNAE